MVSTEPKLAPQVRTPSSGRPEIRRLCVLVGTGTRLESLSEAAGHPVPASTPATMVTSLAGPR